MEHRDTTQLRGNKNGFRFWFGRKIRRNIEKENQKYWNEQISFFVLLSLSKNNLLKLCVFCTLWSLLSFCFTLLFLVMEDDFEHNITTVIVVVCA